MGRGIDAGGWSPSFLARSKNLSVEDLLTDFVSYLAWRERDGHLSLLCELGHGFEDWLKFEMALMLAQHRQYEPWVDAYTPGDVGLEFPAEIAGGGTKQVDLWVSPSRHAEKWHFLEMKVAFENSNTWKQLRSWRNDFGALSAIDRRVTGQQVASIASVVFGVNFPRESLEKALKPLMPAKGARLKWYAVPLRKGLQPLNIAALIAP